MAVLLTSQFFFKNKLNFNAYFLPIIKWFFVHLA